MKILFYLVCFFPFLKWFGIGMDTDVQPYALVISFILIIWYGLKNKIRLSNEVFQFYLLVLCGIGAGTLVTVLFNGVDFNNTLRYYATYFSLIIVSLYSYLLCKKLNGIDEQFVKRVINIYLIVGFVQKYINSTFCYFLVSNARTSKGRGIVSLASEPSFYGYMCIFFMILVWNFKTERRIYMLNLLFQIVFLAKSAITIVYLGFFLIILFVVNLKKIDIKKICIALLTVTVICVTIYYLLNSEANKGQRITWLLQRLLSGQNIMQIIESDASISQRVNAIIICLSGFVRTAGIPNGFQVGKITSGYGSMLLTMGWFGFFIIIFIFSFMRKGYCINGENASKIVSIFITIIMFSGIQISNPMFLFLIGYFMFLSEKNMKEIILEE